MRRDGLDNAMSPNGSRRLTLRDLLDLRDSLGIKGTKINPPEQGFGWEIDWGGEVEYYSTPEEVCEALRIASRN